TLIELTDEGFSPDELTIAAGTTVTFTNVREGAYPDEVVMGVRSARGIDSEELTPGDSWEYTFSETGEFEFVGQYLTTYSLEIIVE
ncbi:hypothetical protein HOD20_01420, partial [archaeon]|nr:hypothetical protein [archaeon]